MRLGTDYHAVWTLEHEEEHAASREAARYLEGVEEAAHTLGAQNRHGFLAEVHDDYTDLDEDWHDIDRTEEEPYDHRVLEDLDIRYQLADGGIIHFEYNREAVPNQFRLRLKGGEEARDAVEDTLDIRVTPTLKRQVTASLASMRNPLPSIGGAADGMEGERTYTVPEEQYSSGEAAVTIDTGRRRFQPYLHELQVAVETEEAAVEYHLDGRGSMWAEVRVPTDTALTEQEHDLPILNQMAGGEPSHTVPVQTALHPVSEDGTVTYQAGVEEDDTTRYTFHYRPELDRPNATRETEPAALLTPFFSVVEAETGLPEDVTEEAFAAVLNEAGLDHPRQDGMFTSEGVIDILGI